MQIPKFLEKGSTIGVIAPSFGANTEPYLTRLKSGLDFLKSEGFKLKFFGDPYGYYMGASASKEERAKHFMESYLDKEVDVIWSVSGGELMVEILPFIDFDLLRKSKPKLFIGYSDNTNITFLMSTLLDTISIYAPCITTFGMKPLDPFLKNTMEIVKGNLITQYASKYHEPYEVPEKGPLDGYTLTEPTKWINLRNEKSIHLKGRVIGGVLDILTLHLGTKYDRVSEFVKRYEKDGIILFLEACDLNIFAYKRALWQLKEAGWFKGIKGILFGRHLNVKPFVDMDLFNVTSDVLGDLNIPIIMEMDIGHVNPMLTMINGAIIEVFNSDEKSKVDFILK